MRKLIVRDRTQQKIVLGLILLAAGTLLKVPILYTIGVVLIVVGVVLGVPGALGHGVGGRTHYY